MRNIRLFEEYNDFLASQESVSGSGKYVEDIFPGFAYVRELFSGDTYAYYNGHEEEDNDYHFGDVIYLASDNTLKSVYWTGYTDSMGPKVGLVVVPSSHAADGNARMIAFNNASGQGLAMSVQPTADDGNKRDGDLLLGEGNEPIYLFNWNYQDNYGMWSDGILCWDIPESERGGETDDYIYCLNQMNASVNPISSDINIRRTQNPFSPSEWYSERVAPVSPPVGSVNPETRDGETVFGNGTMNCDGYFASNGLAFAVSPYLEDGTQNPNYVEPNWDYDLPSGPRSVATLINAFADWNGWANTYALRSNGEDMAYAANDYVTPGTSEGDWYVGAMGEMGYVSSRFWAIEYIMSELGGDDLIVINPAYPHAGQYEIFSSTLIDQRNGTPGILSLFLASLYEDGFVSVQPGSEEYPDDIPSPEYYMSVNATKYTSDASVRPMAMIKGGQIQHGEIPTPPTPPFEEPET